LSGRVPVVTQVECQSDGSARKLHIHGETSR
jgi:hypothetical protein